MCDRLNPYAVTFVIIGFEKKIVIRKSRKQCMVLYVIFFLYLPRFDLQITNKQQPKHRLISITMIWLNKRRPYRCIFLNFHIFLENSSPFLTTFIVFGTSKVNLDFSFVCYKRWR
jgi:hypothetical protein